MEKELKNIELTEENKLHLFCVAWHLTNLLEDTKSRNSWAEPNERIICDTCPQRQKCWQEASLQRYDHFNFLTQITGVKFSNFADSIREIRIKQLMKDLFIEEDLLLGDEKK